MLTFLRKIRKSFIESGATRKYIFYAIGEIALVVIGILIALQINNWNEYRKERVEEKKTLQDVKYTIERNIGSLNFWIETYEGKERSADIVLNAINSNLTYHDSLNAHLDNALFKGPVMHFSREGYEVLKNKGLDIIENDSLKSGIVWLFDGTYEIQRGRMKYANRDEDRIGAFIDENFELVDEMLIPYEPSLILKDRYFRSLIRKLKSQRKSFKERTLQSKEVSETILKMIERELG